MSAATAMSVAQLAEELGVTRQTVHRCATEWHGPVGQGCRRHLSEVDVMVARAWKAIGDQYEGQVAERCRRVADAAVRGSPRRWLLLVIPASAYMCDTATDAGRLWLRIGATTGMVVDLAPEDTAVDRPYDWSTGPPEPAGFADPPGMRRAHAPGRPFAVDVALGFCLYTAGMCGALAAVLGLSGWGWISALLASFAVALVAGVAVASKLELPPRDRRRSRAARRVGGGLALVAMALVTAASPSGDRPVELDVDRPTTEPDR